MADELFENSGMRTSWPPTADRVHPLIELDELVLVGTFSPPTSIEIRRIRFKRGLNIVWADPHTADPGRRDRTSGHSAGKSTLCRILRWLLGESHFGTEDLEGRVASQFENGCAILSLKLDGRPWVVGRGFFSKQDHQALEDVTLQQILAEGWPEDAGAARFLIEIEELTFRPFPRRKFPGRSGEISWLHLLGWLARDQEAALQSVDAWRSSAGGPQDRGPTKFERHTLIRMIANLLPGEEWDQMDRAIRLDAEKKDIAEQIPGVRAVAEEACRPLSYLLDSTSDPLAGELILSQAEQALHEREERLGSLEREIADHVAARVRRNHDQTVEALAHARGKLAQHSRRAKKINSTMADIAGILLKAKANLDMLKPPAGYCARKRDEVLGKCDLYQDGAENIAAAAMMAQLEQKQAELKEQIDAEAAEVEEIAATLDFLEKNEAQARTAAEEAEAERDGLIRQAEGLRFAAASLQHLLEPTQEKWATLDRKKSAIADLSGQASEARRMQANIRRGLLMDRLNLADHYRAVLAYLLGPDIGGHLELDRDGQLVLGAENRSSLSSAAIEALKTIAFDLASVFRSVTGGGHHPRFLIHDSPKVADMSPGLYSAIFDLVEEVENQGGEAPTFQYLLTTTEPPPPRFRDSGHIVLHLDASSKEGRLFSADL